MALREVYRRQVALLIRVLPIVTTERAFALKGGTAINLFVRDMPRLSVDIDLTYLPVATRDQSLVAIDAGMQRMAARLAQSIPGARAAPSRLQPEDVVTKLVVRAEGVQIKIEVTPVLRGCVFAPEIRAVSPTVEESFGFAEAQVVSFADLYAGKLVAAFDRQHPRDLFDVRALMAAEGVSEDLRKAFLIYMMSHGRPMAEVLAPTRKSLEQSYQREFQGMTAEPVAIESLVAAREAMIAELVGRMPQDHRLLLVQFERGEPDWPALGLHEAAKLPAIQWRQQNLDKLSARKRADLVAKLEQVLFGG